MTEARYSHGMILRHRVRDTGDYQTVGGIFEQSVPSPTRQKVLTTGHEDKSQTSIAGRLIEYSDLTLSVNYTPSTDAVQLQITSGIDPDGGNGRIDGWEIETPDGEFWRFQGYVQVYDVQTPQDDRITADLTICVTNIVTTGVNIDYQVLIDDTTPVALTEIEASVSPAPPGAVTWQWQRLDGTNWEDIEEDIDTLADSATFTPDAGYVDSLTIVNGGSGFTGINAVSIDPVRFGGRGINWPTSNDVRATFTAELTGGVITSATLTERGRGYSEAPIADALGSGGSGQGTEEFETTINTEAGHRLRVCATFVDNNGDTQTIYSDPTAAVTLPT